MTMTAYKEITRADMAGFDRECIDLALEAQAMGWTGRMSSKGHMILRAPDGETTMSISRRWSNGRSGPNMRANFDRWLRAQIVENEVASFQRFSDAWDDAEQHRFIELMIRGLTDAANEFDGDDAERTKVIYRNILEAPKVAPFAYRVATEGRIKDFGIIIGYSDEIAEDARRPWNVNWAVYDARSMEVIDFGGPRNLDGRPWDEERISLLVVEKVRQEREEAEAEQEALTVQMDDHLTVVVDSDRPYACEVCGRTFKRPMNLGRHMSTTHKPALRFEGDPMEDGLDDLMNESNPIGQPDSETLMVVDGPVETAAAMGRVVDDLGKVAKRMAMLESERDGYEARLAEMSARYDEEIRVLTEERDKARESVAALKAIVADL